MLRPLFLGTCLATVLSGCVSLPHHKTAQLYPFVPQPSSAADKAATEAKAAAVRTNAQRDSTAANEATARRASCTTDTGPRLPVSSSQCAPYGSMNSDK